MKIKIKKTHPEAKLPQYMSEGACGMDMTAVSRETLQLGTGAVIQYDTGISIEIPKGYVGLIAPRSSITTKTSLFLGNSIGVIDSDYRGTIKFQFRATSFSGVKAYEVGDRIGQIMFVPCEQVELQEVDELEDTKRGSGGHGSTGVK